jgi:acetoin utilization protein AcuC
VVFDDTLTDYDFGPQHPMAPVRIDLTVALARELGVIGDGGVPLVPAPVATEDQILTVHDVRLIEAVQRMSRAPGAGAEAFGLGSDDNPVFLGMHRAAAHVVGASLAAFDQVATGASLHSANITGGLHHAMPDRAAGFCVYNDVAIGIRSLLDRGVGKVAYVDVDVHHGDGVERVFWDDPRVLTISLHESGRFLFPGTGAAGDTGGPGAEGFAVNVSLPPGTGDAGWLRAFHAVVPDLLRAFQPDVLVTQHGCDSHVADPLADLQLSVDGQRAAALALHDLAHETAGGRWVALGGGGYAVVDVVPRTWTHLLGVVGGRPLDPTLATPESWLAMVRERLGRAAPAALGDLGGGREPSYRPWEEGYDPDTWLDREVLATRRAAFPQHGLDPEL